MSSLTASQKRERSRSRERSLKTPKVDGDAPSKPGRVTVRLLATKPEDGCEVLSASCTDPVLVDRSADGYGRAINLLAEAIQRQSEEDEEHDESGSNSPVTLADIFDDEWLAATVIVEDPVALKTLGRAQSIRELRKVFGLRPT